MSKICVLNTNINIGKRLIPENIFNEYKEFSIVPFRSEDHDENQRVVKELIRGNFPRHLNTRIIDSIESYFDKYFAKYFVSLANPTPENSRKNYARLLIGVKDSPSIVTGIPVLKSELPELIEKLEKKIKNYLSSIQTFHFSRQNNKYLEIEGEKYYNYDKLLKIIRRLFCVNIHILNKNKLKNKCVKRDVNHIYKSYRQYKIIKKTYTRDRKKIIDSNNRYSQSISLIIYNYEIMNLTERFIKKDNPNYPFKHIHQLLKLYLKDRDCIKKYIDGGEFICGSMKSQYFSDDKIKEFMDIFLNKFRDYRNIRINKINSNKIRNPYKKKFNPLNDISNTLLQINNFNNIVAENNQVIQLLIEIKIPIIKDNNAIIGFNNKNGWFFPKRKLVVIGGDYSPITIKGS